MAAAMNGHVEGLKALIREGADLNIKDGNGDTALILAAKSKSGTCLEHTVESGS